MRAFLHAILCVALLWSLMGIQLSINLFGWYPNNFNASTAVAAVIFLTCSGLLFLLGYKAGNAWATSFMAVFSVAVIILGCSAVFSEKLDPDTFLGRKAYSPVYYKAALAFCFSLPLTGILIGLFSRRYAVVISRKNQSDG